MDKKLRDTIKSLLSDIDAMRCEAPYDVQQDGDGQDQQHWFGSFSNQGMNEAGDAIFQWPNLSLLAEQIRALLPADKVQIGRPL